MADMDTAAKRLSALDWDQPWNSGIPIPDGLDVAGDRQHGMWTYSGVSSGAITTTAELSGRVWRVTVPATATVNIVVPGNMNWRISLPEDEPTWSTKAQ